MDKFLGDVRGFVFWGIWCRGLWGGNGCYDDRMMYLVKYLMVILKVDIFYNEIRWY